MEKRYSLIALNPETHERLKQVGKFGETYGKIVERLLNERQQEQHTTN